MKQAINFTSACGGQGNTASGSRASVTGGFNNSASGIATSVSGGFGHSATGNYDWRAGSLFEKL